MPFTFTQTVRERQPDPSTGEMVEVGPSISFTVTVDDDVPVSADEISRRIGHFASSILRPSGASVSVRSTVAPWPLP